MFWTVSQRGISWLKFSRRFSAFTWLRTLIRRSKRDRQEPNIGQFNIDFINIIFLDDLSLFFQCFLAFSTLFKISYKSSNEIILKGPILNVCLIKDNLVEINIKKRKTEFWDIFDCYKRNYYKIALLALNLRLLVIIEVLIFKFL